MKIFLEGLIRVQTQGAWTRYGWQAGPLVDGSVVPAYTLGEGLNFIVFLNVNLNSRSGFAF